MKLSLDGIVAVLIGIFGLIAILSAAFAVARSNYAKTQIEDLRGANADQEKRIKFLESDNARLSTGFVAEQQKVEVLEKIVTGKEDLEAIKLALTLLSSDMAIVKNALVTNT